MENNNLNNLTSLLNKFSNNHDSVEFIEALYNFLDSINNPEINKIIANTSFFGTDKSGKSGSKVGITHNNDILKYYNLGRTIYVTDHGKKSVKLYNPFNELVINIIFNDFVKKNKKYKRFFIPIKSIGIYKNISYIISEKVGITVDKVYYTNLHDILTNNHIPFLLKNINEQKYIDEWCRSLVITLSKYFDCMKYLNLKLKYINTDLKCKNVFIKTNNKKSNINFITNYIPLVSDLDKATIKLNDITIMSRENSILAKFLVKYNKTRFSKVYEFRHDCKRNLNLCNKFQPHQYDILTLFYDIYIILHINLYLPQKKREKMETFFHKLNLLNIFFRKRLNLDEKQFLSIYKSINKTWFLNYRKDHRLALHINSMLHDLCKII